MQPLARTIMLSVLLTQAAVSIYHSPYVRNVEQRRTSPLLALDSQTETEGER